MDTAIGISQDNWSSSLPPDLRLQGPDTRRPDVVWSMTPQLQEIVECDPGMISDLFSLFVEDSAARLRILSCACTNGDFKIVRAQAHSLKGSSLQIGAAGLGSLCAALELSNRSEPEMCGSPVGIESVGTESVGIESIMRAIDDEFVLVRRAIEGYLVVQGGTK